MRILLFTAIILLPFIGIGQVFLDIRDFGAIGDGVTVNTVQIQAAIDSANSVGGGTVLITEGKYVSSTLRLRSNVTLRISEGDTLFAVPLNDDYPDISYNEPSWSDTYTKKSLLFAEDAENIRITGGGMIHGNGRGTAYLGVTKNYRPFGLRIHGCNGVEIDSIHLENAPHWMGHVTECKNVWIHDMTIYNHGFGSNDGWNIDGCDSVLVERCIIDSNDDPIVMKTHSETPCKNVLVRNLEVATFERGVKVGNESLGHFENIRIENILIRQSNFGLSLPPQTAIYLAIADGGSAENIVFENIEVQTPYDTPIFIRLCLRGNQYDVNAPAPQLKFLKNVLVKNVNCEAATDIPSSITGQPGYRVENVRLENIAIQTSGNGPAGTANQPELASTRPENDIWGNTLPSYGLYVRHVEGLILDSFCVLLDSPDVRPMLYFEDTSEIAGGACKDVVSSVSNEKSEDVLYVYPNPSRDILTYRNAPRHYLLQLIDISGRVVFIQEVEHDSGKGQLNISEYPSGMYLFSVRGDGFYFQKKILLQH